jgi:tripartite-type tricarboxylate transporter receptor subunit TctC
MYRNVLAALGALCACAWATTAPAQDYPNRAIRVVVPFAAGAGTDATGRLAADELSQRLGQPLVVENKAGAGSQIGIDFVAKAKPDGYTLLWTASDGIAVLPAVKPVMPYRVPEDFTYIARLILLPYVVAVNPRLPIKSLPELIAYAKANPGKLRYGTSGIGTATHMGTALVAKAAGIDMLHVPFTGVAPAVNALLGDSVDVVLAAPSSIKPHADAGTLRAIATTGKERPPSFPDVPTLEEAGLANVTIVVWYGLMAPAGTPEPVLARLRSDVAEMLKDPKVIARMRTLGYQPSYLGGAQFRDFVVSDLEQWKSVARSSNIVVE